MSCIITANEKNSQDLFYLFVLLSLFINGLSKYWVKKHL